MQLSNIYSFPTSYAKTNVNVSKTKNEDSGQFVAASQSEPNDKSSIWNDLSEKYDIRNCSIDELNEAASSLYKAEQISLKDLAVLTLRPSVLGENDGYLTPLSAAGKRNWIAEFEARLKQDMSFGNMLGAENKRHALDILKRLAK